MMKATNDNFKWTAQKTITSTLSALMLATSLGCSTRDEKFEKHLSTWIDDIPTQCATLGEESELTLNSESNAKDRLRNIRDLWEKTPEGRTWKDHVVNSDLAFCFGKPVSEVSRIGLSPKVDAYLLDADLSNEEVARSILTKRVLKEYNKAVEWSEKYKPADALLWSRAMKGHKTNIELSQAYQMADQNFDSPIWQDVENNSYVKKQAQSFKEIVQQGATVEEAHSAVLEDYLGDTERHTSNDRTFLKWYNTELLPKTVTELQACIKYDFFEGTFSPGFCDIDVQVPPDENVAANNISSEALGKLSSAYTASAYLNNERVANLLNNADNYDISQDNISQFATVKKNAEKCCGENRIAVGGGLTAGLTFSGKAYIAF